MLSLKIDGEFKSFGSEGETTFGQVMKKLSSRLGDEGLVITGITMNNQPLSGGRQFDYNDFPLTEVELIELDTAKPLELAAEALKSSDEHLRILAGVSIRSAELYRLGDELEANESYSRLIEGLRWMGKGMNAMAGMMKISLDEIIFNGKSIAYFQNEVLIPVLDNMYSTQKDEDWIALADILEYELIPVLEEWSKLITGLKAKMASN
ncbi:MAG: hypothetical protein HQ591_03855 [candidate division Zixibacteria bacterium]|nr:hypothetical protein [Candidatus Tariuqbacter arcticus]